MSTEPSSAVATSTHVPSSGRLAVMTAYAMAASAIPVPFLPSRLLTRVRGAVVHDVVSRHGLSLTSDARDALSSPDSDRRTRLVRAAETVARQILKRVGPLAFLSTASRGLELYALGFLLERYIVKNRKTSAVRVHAEEARKVRDAIDRAVLRAFSPNLRPSAGILESGMEDLRDELTRWVDAALLTTATLPSYVERRLEAAFDEVTAEIPGFGE